MCSVKSIKYAVRIQRNKTIYSNDALPLDFSSFFNILGSCSPNNLSDYIGMGKGWSLQLVKNCVKIRELEDDNSGGDGADVGST